ncbi:hypothetical protein LAWI1_G004944 [Lachnellula willkommii]|uniref:DUF7707 domain-containing protein n=1 Tax=Lachnellula willkommii TaxID=215461 RepID=A0A559M7K7_9HELO|nr:hypothetical protein LAWI1_G004944 [Lachnellula willkommii]
MPSFKIIAAVVATALYTLGAQAQTYTIDPSSVPIATRGMLFKQAIANPFLTHNRCLVRYTKTIMSVSMHTSIVFFDHIFEQLLSRKYTDSLTFSCVCGNGISPNASEFSETLPYFICTEYGSQCVAACNGNTDCQSNCRSQHPCGAQNPVRVNTSTSSVMPSTTSGGASNTQVYNGLAGATTTAASGKKSGAQSAQDIGRSYGLAVVFAGIFAGFALVT